MFLPEVPKLQNVCRYRGLQPMDVEEGTMHVSHVIAAHLFISLGV